MTWLAWRQFRTQAWVAAGIVAVAAIAYGFTGIALHRLAADSGYPGCIPTDLCRGLVGAVKASTAYSVLYYAGLLTLYVLPVVIGLFWGAPLVARDLESGNHRLLWTQSIGRTKWLAVKVVVVGATVLATTALISLAITWWAAPLDAVGGLTHDGFRLSPLQFGARGVVPIGYAVFAFALGVVVGLLTRRTLPAMAITFAILVAVQVAFPLILRGHLLTPVTTTQAITGDGRTALVSIELVGPDELLVFAHEPPIGAWTISAYNIDSSGALTLVHPPEGCLRGTPDACSAAIARLHIGQSLTYHPPERFWPLQVYETGLLLLAAVALLCISLWYVRRVN